MENIQIGECLYPVYLTEQYEEQMFDKAWAEAGLSTCLKKKVGAVLFNVIQGRVMGIGHGGAVVPCERCVRKEYEWQQDGCWSIHSEMRAIFNSMNKPTANMHGVGGPPVFRSNFKDCIMFVTHGPCDQCIKLCHLFGIPLMVYDEDYHNDYSKWDGKIRIQKRGELHEFDVS